MQLKETGITNEIFVIKTQMELLKKINTIIDFVKTISNEDEFENAIDSEKGYAEEFKTYENFLNFQIKHIKQLTEPELIFIITLIKMIKGENIHNMDKGGSGYPFSSDGIMWNKKGQLVIYNFQ